MNRPLRGDRESAATTRYVGCLVLPIRMSRSFTATVCTSLCQGTHLRGPASLLGRPRSIQSRQPIIADSGDGERRRLAGGGPRALGGHSPTAAFALAFCLLHLAAEPGHVAHPLHHL